MTRKQRHLLTRIIVAAVLFLAGSLLHLPELAEMAVFLVCYVLSVGILSGRQSRTSCMDRCLTKIS